MRRARACPVCGTDARDARVFIEENIDPAKLSSYSFASRKEPEYMSHRLVQCPACDLVYVDQPPEDSELAHAYHLAAYDSAEEAADAARAYFGAIRPTLERLPRRGSALEIGSGTGVFLEHLAGAGFSEVVGVEPSGSAIEAAPAQRRGWLRHGIFRESDFAPESFDLICCFMTLEHVPDPTELARAAINLLRPRGALVTVTHDYRALVNRMLGRRSPIIDVEHMQLFSRESVRQLFARSGYTGIAVHSYANTYALRYWMRLAPMPRALKNAMSGALRGLRLDDVKLKFNVGNLISVGFKPG